VLVLCYHAVSDDWPADLAVTSTSFRQQLELVLERGYRSAIFSDALTAVESPTVVITFDDAYRSVLEIARPLLASLGAVATVFAVTDFATSQRRLMWPGIDHWAGGAFQDELVGLTWDELASLRGEGWEIGSHTVSHPRLTTLDDQALAAELRDSKRVCEEALGVPCLSLAYPYGDVDQRVARAAADAGYRAAAALPARFHAPEPFAWPRVGLYRPDSLRRFRVKTSVTVRALRVLLGR
jgi:peptidoglycan/xylan/chitin deacetylase (PgdA/CDA1 family)